MRSIMSEWRCLRLRVRGGEDCVICAFHEDLEVLQAWMRRLGLPYRGQRLAGAASEVFLHLRRAGIRPALGTARSRNISASSARRPSPQRRASWTTSSPCTSPSPHRPRTCRPRNKTALEFSHATLESRFSRRAYEA